jgi:hypothetical protein
MLHFGAWLFLSAFSAAQVTTVADAPNQRAFTASPSEIQAAVSKLKPTFSGRLPTLDGFVVPGPSALDQYQRPYFQCTVRVAPASSGKSLVIVTAKITAWHENPPHSRYEVLQSNGRLEADLLARLEDSIAPKPAVSAKSAPVTDISAPMPQLPKYSAPISGSAAKPQDSQLEQEASSLQDVLRNQTHPTNLVAVKDDRTPVLENARTDGKVLFLASAEDEFEVLETNSAWVHVRISGLSRGWLRRSNVEMLDGSKSARTEHPPGSAPVEASNSPRSTSAFSVSSEEVGTFPGDWTLLKGKSTRIISVQQGPSSGRITSPQDKLQFAASVFKKETLPAGVEGLVVIFDAEDGGMVASTRESLEQWRRGSLSDAAFWNQCLLDPPEILGTKN